ncbi:MAG TPA: acylphosphatase [Methanocorpusculum sp.]|nr:acylphosphatase [Methanocorpusculum sp.]
MKVRKHYIFKGRVQGVGFRITVYQKAQQLKLTGWVRNLSSGHVEACFQGEDENIKDLVRYMKSIRYIRIDDMEIEALALLENETSFELKF